MHVEGGMCLCARALCAQVLCVHAARVVGIMHLALKVSVHGVPRSAIDIVHAINVVGRQREVMFISSVAIEDEPVRIDALRVQEFCPCRLFMAGNPISNQSKVITV